MPGRLDNYEPVEDRLARFWQKHPEGRITTDLVHRDERQYIFRAEAFTDRDDSRPAAVGYAEEIIGSSAVNKTNALENAETSAIGRCLANLGFAPKGARPSREEMEKAQRGNPRSSETSNGKAPQGSPNGEPTLAQRAKTAVDTMLAAPTVDKAEAMVSRAYNSPARDVDVTGLLTQYERDTVGIQPGEKVNLHAFAHLVLAYVEKHGRAVNAAEATT